MKKVRIIKRTNVDGNIRYIIQQPHWIFKWWWVDAWMNSWEGAYCSDNFSSLEEAKRNLCYFDGSEGKEEVINDYP